jgi:hypothetical protein
MATSARRPRKTCPDCGVRGNWPKKIVINTCPDCTNTRLKHDGIRKQFYDACERVQDGKHICRPSSPTKCPSCTKYYASDTHKFWVSLR